MDQALDLQPFVGVEQLDHHFRRQDAHGLVDVGRAAGPFVDVPEQPGAEQRGLDVCGPSQFRFLQLEFAVTERPALPLDGIVEKPAARPPLVPQQQRHHDQAGQAERRGE